MLLVLDRHAVDLLFDALDGSAQGRKDPRTEVEEGAFPSPVRAAHADGVKE